MHDMNVVRKNIRLSEDGQIQRDMSKETFWDGVVANAAAVLEPGRVSDSPSARVILITRVMFIGHTGNFPKRSEPI